LINQCLQPIIFNLTVKVRRTV